MGRGENSDKIHCPMSTELPKCNAAPPVCRKEAQADEGNQKEYTHHLIKKMDVPVLAQTARGGRARGPDRDSLRGTGGVREQRQGSWRTQTMPLDAPFSSPTARLGFSMFLTLDCAGHPVGNAGTPWVALH